MNNKLTDIQIVPVKPRDGLVGFASFVFSDLFYFSSIGIFTRPQGGYRLTYPTRKSNQGYSLSIFHPIDKELAKEIEDEVTKEYEKLIDLY